MPVNYKTPATENKKPMPVYKFLLQQFKITEVRQIQIIIFWLTLILFAASAILMLLGI